MPGQLLAAFKAAAPRLGLSPRLVHAVDWLFRFTQPQDWGRGGRPIVWPSASMQQEALGLSATRVKAINRALIEAGLITMKDSPNGKRYGKRDPKGRIVEAYGFDLSPIAARHAEFVRLAEEAQAERAELGRLRRRATIARNGIAQILETAAEYGFQGEEWIAPGPRHPGPRQGAQESREARGNGAWRGEPGAAAAHGARAPGKPAGEVAAAASEAVNSDPLGTENGPHQYTYKPSLDPEQDTVIAHEGSSAGGRRRPSAPDTSAGAAGTAGAGQGAETASPDELVRLAPRLKPYLRRPDPTWPEIVDAADCLRHDLDVSKSLWGEACLAMGREQAAIAMAIVSTKDPGHFRTTPGGISMAWWPRRRPASSTSTARCGPCAAPPTRHCAATGQGWSDARPRAQGARH